MWKTQQRESSMFVHSLTGAKGVRPVYVWFWCRGMNLNSDLTFRCNIVFFIIIIITLVKPHTHPHAFLGLLNML